MMGFAHAQRARQILGSGSKQHMNVESYCAITVERERDNILSIVLGLLFELVKGVREDIAHCEQQATSGGVHVRGQVF